MATSSLDPVLVGSASRPLTPAGPVEPPAGPEASPEPARRPPKTWAEVAQDPRFQSLSSQEQDAARQAYFDDVIRPQVSEAEVMEARRQFDADTQSGALARLGHDAKRTLDRAADAVGPVVHPVFEALSGPEAGPDAPSAPRLARGGVRADRTAAPLAAGPGGLPPEARALLDTIAGTESPGYNVLYGGQRFQGYADHPRVDVPIQNGPNRGKTSSAAGRYQFLKGTWDEQRQKLGLPDFSPASQDAAAWNLAQETYRAKTRRDLLTDLRTGDPAVRAGIGKALSGVWTSLPSGIEATTRGDRFAREIGQHLPAGADGALAQPADATRDPRAVPQELYGLALKPGYIDTVQARYDAASPAERARMVTQDSVEGRVARFLADRYRQADRLRAVDPALSGIGTRREEREQGYLNQGFELPVAKRLADDDLTLGRLPRQLMEPPRPDLGEQVGQDWRRGVLNTQAMGAGLAAWALDAVGQEDKARDFLNDYQALEQEAARYAPVVGDFANIGERGAWQVPEDAARYMTEAVVGNLPNFLPSLAAGGAGGLVARRAAQGVVNQLVERLGAAKAAQFVAEKAAAGAQGFGRIGATQQAIQARGAAELAQQGVTQALQRQAVQTGLGAAAGAGAASVGMETGSIYGDIYQQTGQMRPGVAGVAGLAAGALDAIPAMRAATKLVGPQAASQITGTVLSRLGKEAGIQFLSEGGTEFVQTLIENGAVHTVAGQPLVNEADLHEALNAALQGGFAGGMTGAATQGWQEARRPPARAAQLGQALQQQIDRLPVATEPPATVPSSADRDPAPPDTPTSAGLPAEAAALPQESGREPDTFTLAGSAEPAGPDDRAAGGTDLLPVPADSGRGGPGRGDARRAAPAQPAASPAAAGDMPQSDTGPDAGRLAERGPRPPGTAVHDPAVADTGPENVATAPAANGWDELPPAAREARAAQAGWGTRKGGASAFGRKLARKSWAEITPEQQAKLQASAPAAVNQGLTTEPAAPDTLSSESSEWPGAPAAVPASEGSAPATGGPGPADHVAGAGKGIGTAAEPGEAQEQVPVAGSRDVAEMDSGMRHGATPEASSAVDRQAYPAEDTSAAVKESLTAENPATAQAMDVPDSSAPGPTADTGNGAESAETAPVAPRKRRVSRAAAAMVRPEDGPAAQAVPEATAAPDEVRFQRAAPDDEAAARLGRARAALGELAKHDELFQLPRPEGRAVAGIAGEIDPAIRVKEARPGAQWDITMPDGAVGVLRKDRDGKLYLDASRLSSGVSQGHKLYAIASAYAHNNGLVFKGDPNGLSRMAMIRRTESMLSSALKYGTTRHLEPHPNQNIDWDPADEAGNLERLLAASYRNASEGWRTANYSAIPGLENITFNFDSGRFEYLDTGTEVTHDDFERIAKTHRGLPPRYNPRRGESPAVAGSATVKRAALIRALLRAEGGQVPGARRGGSGDALLAAATRQRGAERLDAGLPDALENIFYRRAGAAGENSSAPATPPADPSATEALNQGLARRFGDPAWENAYVQWDLPDSLAEFAEAARAAFGAEIVGFTATDARFDQFNGIHYQGRNFVNLNANVGFVNVAGHEIWHQLRKDRPDLYRWFAHQARAHYRNFGEYQDRLNALVGPDEEPYNRDAAEEELLADFAGDALADPAFVQRLAKADPGRFRRLLNAVVSWLHGVAGKLRQAGLASSRHFRDVETLRGFLAEALVAYAQGGPVAVGQVAAPGFSRSAMTSYEEHGPGDAGAGRAAPASTATTASLTRSGSGAGLDGSLAQSSREGNLVASSSEDGDIRFARRRPPRDDAADLSKPASSDLPAWAGDPEQVFAPIDAAIRQGGGWSGLKGELEKTWHRMSGTARRQALGALTVRQLVELGETVLPRLPDYLKNMTGMAVTRNQVLHEVDAIAKDWEALDKSTLGRLALVMHESTLAGVDGAETYTPSIDVKEAGKRIGILKRRQLEAPGDHNISAWQAEIRDLRRQVAFEQRRREAYHRIRALFQALPAPARDIYRRARDFHVAQSKRVEQALVEMIEKTQMSAPSRAAAVEKLRLEFEAQRVNAPYFPLSRQGDYWVSLRPPGEDGARALPNEFHMFQTLEEQQAFIKDSQAAGLTILGRGKQLENLQEALGVPGSFVAQVEGILADLPDSPLVDAARDQVYQLYLTTLPDLSARRHFIHRKKTPGFGQDALRAFAHKGYHDAYQYARVKHGFELRAVMEKLREDLATATSKPKMAALKRRRDWLEEFRDEVLHGGMDYYSVVERANSMSLQAMEVGAQAGKRRLTEGERFVVEEQKKWAQFVAWMDEWKHYGGIPDRHRQELADIGRRIETSRRLNSRERGYELAADVYNELQQAYAWLMNPRTAPWATVANQLGYLWNLAFSPSAWLTNATQNPLVAMPFVAARHGVAATGKAFTQAYREAFRGALTRNSGKEHPLGLYEALSDPDERRAYEQALEAGIIDRGRALDLAGVAEEGQARAGWHRKFALAMTVGFHDVERLNRETTFMAAYRLARRAGDDAPAAVDYASQVVHKTHLDYASENRPRVMRPDVARVMFQFKLYSQGITYLLGRAVLDSVGKHATAAEKAEARKFLALQSGLQAAAAGALGLPIGLAWWAAQAAFAALFDDDDDPRELEAEFRQALAELLGQTGGEAVAKGLVNALSPIDLHSRVGMRELWFREADREVEGRDAASQLIGNAMGPMAGIVENLAVGAQLIGEGHVYRGIEKMAPKALRDLLKSGRYASEGAQTLKGDPLVEDLTAGELLGQALGFTPARLGERYDENNATMNREKRIEDRRKDITGGLAQSRIDAAKAQQAGDADTYAKAQARFEEALAQARRFNEKNPAAGITGKTVGRSIQSRVRARAMAQHGIFPNRKVPDAYDFATE